MPFVNSGSLESMSCASGSFVISIYAHGVLNVGVVAISNNSNIERGLSIEVLAPHRKKPNVFWWQCKISIISRFPD